MTTVSAVTTTKYRVVVEDGGTVRVIGDVTSALSAALSAADAADSATTAAASASAAASSATSASASATTATTQAGAASTSATAAAASASAASSSATAAASSATSASASASSASASATTATNQAAAAAASALSAASVVSQDLSAIDRTVFAATIVDAFLYDTSKDSDGGAWRKRCSHTSWENETLSGNWLGSAANETAARAISGATTGSYYYDTTAAAFYTLNAGSGKTATYRGNVRQFPAQVLITAEANRVVIWDITQAGCPMWMVFSGGADTLLYSSSNVSSVAMMNGMLTIGKSAYAASFARFIRDDGELRDASRTYWDGLRISGRNSAGHWTSSVTSGNIVNNTVNDVAMTVLPTAPIDVATGLPVPTIAVATNGGVSVILQDGTVVNDTCSLDTTVICNRVAFTKEGRLFRNWYTDGNRVGIFNGSTGIPSASFSTIASYDLHKAPATTGPVAPMLPFDCGYNLTKVGMGSSVGLVCMRQNPADRTKTMFAAITKDYNSGWMVGDIRGAWLADTVAETITGTELVTNGTFDTDTTGWTPSFSTPGVASGEVTVTGTTNGQYGLLYQAFPTVVGAAYKLTGTARVGTSSIAYIQAGTTANGGQLVAKNTGSGTNVTLTGYFIATGTTSYVSIAGDNVSGHTAIFDNVSIKRVSADRSVKNVGMTVNGSLTKTAVASGAQLMGYSGFSAVNFFEQPYNSDLDFGTGDFCIMGWAYLSSLGGTNHTILHRCLSGSTGGLLFMIASTGEVLVFATNGTGYATSVGSAASTMPTAGWAFLVARRSGTTLSVHINAVSKASGTVSGNLTYTNAVTRVGLRMEGTYQHAGSVALLRASATAPSDEQIKHIYETEKALFQASAQCCLAGTSNAVTALAYDDETDLLHVGTSYGRSAFKGLVRVSSEATPVGAITALAASAGVIVQGGASGVDVYVPAYTLREELLRDAEQMAKFGQNLIAHDFTATASQTTFTLPVGWEIVAVYQQGAIKRETTSWTRSFDGFKWSAVLGTGATVSDWISILAKRV